MTTIGHFTRAELASAASWYYPNRFITQMFEQNGKVYVELDHGSGKDSPILRAEWVKASFSDEDKNAIKLTQVWRSADGSCYEDEEGEE